MEYQVKMVYEQADVAALVRTLDYRRRPDRNTRRAMKIAGPIFGVLLIGVAAGVIAGAVSLGAFVPATFVHPDLGGDAAGRRGADPPGRHPRHGAPVLEEIPQQGHDRHLHVF